MMKYTVFLGFQHFVLFNGLQWELLLIHSREKSFFCCFCCCCCLPSSAWGRSWIMCLTFSLTPGLPCDVPWGPIKSFLVASLQKKAKCWRKRLLWLRELQDLWKGAASHHYGLDEGRDISKAIWAWGALLGDELHTRINCPITGQKYSLGVFPS